MAQINKALHLSGAIVRTLLGLTFIFSGFVKAVDPLGTTYKIEDYLGAFGGWFMSLTPLAFTAAVCLIAFEFVLGWLLLTNSFTKLTSWLALLMMLVMTPLTLYLALTNPISDCGCFGDAVVLSNWATFWKNVVLLALVIYLLAVRRHVPQTFIVPVEVGMLFLALGFAAGIMTYSVTHLPFLDFRPYKIGNNIPELMTLPDDAKQDIYEISFIYEKDGEQREFSLSDYPKDDSTWVFVDQKSTLIQKGDEAPIHDFIIYNEELDDITFDILEDERPVTLAILYKVEKTNLKQAARLCSMAENADLLDQPFYLITGSGDDEIEAFREATGYEYPIYNCDPVTLKTIVRANPGIVVLEQGTVVDKYNLRNR